MDYIVDYEICALFILIVILFYTRFNPQFPSKKNSVYIISLSIAIIDVLTNIISTWTIGHADVVPAILNMIINTIYYCCQGCLAALMYVFILTLVDKHDFHSPKQLIIGLIPIVISEALILSNPWTGLIFYFDKNHLYTFGKLQPLIYLNTVYYMILFIYTGIRYRKNLSRREKLSLTFFVVSFSFAMSFQFFHPRYLLIGFGIALTMLVMFLTMQHPAEMRDNTTGLFNRTSLSLALKSMRKQDKPKPIILFFIDDLMTISTIMGGHMTDRLSEEIAKFLSTKFRNHLNFRLDRYTFGILPKNEHDLKSAISELKQRFGQTWNIEDTQIILTPAICFTTVSSHKHFQGEVLDMMIKQLQEKIETSDIVVTELDDKTLTHLNRELAVEKALRDAIAADSLSVWFQPLYNQRTKSFPCAEALARFEHPTMGFISPGEFIPIAEKNNLVDKIGQQMVEKACIFLSENNMAHYPNFRSISVNLSVAELMQRSLPENIMKILNKYHIDPGLIRFEVTETAATITHQTLSNSINQLRKSDLQFLLDDFGSGYANFSSVIELPFSGVKIDRSMLLESFVDDKKMIVFDQTIQMISGLGMEVIVEGAEESWQAEILKSKNVDMVQGYFYARPMPANDYLEFLKHH